jgi:hypothetical protein
MLPALLRGHIHTLSSRSVSGEVTEAIFLGRILAALSVVLYVSALG